MTNRLTKEREAEIRAWLNPCPEEPVLWEERAARELLAELDATREELREARERIARQEASIGELREEVARYDASANGCADDLHRCQREKRDAESRVRELGAIVSTARDDLRHEEEVAESGWKRVRELEAQLAAPPTTYLPADGPEEPVGEVVARLTRERDEALAQLAALREAASQVCCDVCPYHDEPEDCEPCSDGVAHGSLRAALTDTAPTAEAYTRRVQAEALRKAASRFAYDHQDAPSAEVVVDWLRAEAERLEKGGGS